MIIDLPTEIQNKFMKIIRYYTAYKTPCVFGAAKAAGMTTDELYYEFLQTIQQFEEEHGEVDA